MKDDDEDGRPHRKHCVCADCKADRDVRYAALRAEAAVDTKPVKRRSKPREPYAETRVRDRRPAPLMVPVPTSHGAPLVRKEDARCCNARRDLDGRLPIGWCGPDCERRPNRGSSVR